ncbi:hypothetical protein V6N12_016972 [Hibiscus sabdariffa]|uniref:EDS1 EP domain-containing protein n=1 Tax=Hibiscus sabdariffa TaxID=183260 RepID=A0ABR2AUX1_9ROSI
MLLQQAKTPSRDSTLLHPIILTPRLKLNFRYHSLCCENGCTCSENPEAVSEQLMAIGTKDATNEGRTIRNLQQLMFYDRIVEQLESIIIHKGVSQLGNIAYWNQQPKDKELDNRRIGIDMYVKQEEETGYYDCYKNRFGRSDHNVIKHKKFLTTNWEEIVAQAEKKAEITTDSPTITVAVFQPHHYIKSEQWLEEDEKQSGVLVDSKKKQNADVILTDDSCFWVHVEKARICCKSMETADIEIEEGVSLRQKLKEIMEQLKKAACSMV